MSVPAFYHVQAIELRRLIEEAEEDPILVPQLQSRLEAIEALISEGGHEPEVTMPRAAIFLSGGGVNGIVGIRPSLAADALTLYEKMFVSQAIHDERMAVRGEGKSRRPKGAAKPELLFTGTPRGSFGLEFVAQPPADTALLEVRKQTLVKLTNAISRVAMSDENSFDDAVTPIPSEVLKPLTSFFKTLAQNGAELRLAIDDDRATIIDANQITATSDRLEKDIRHEKIEVRGKFRGIARETGIFDLRISEFDYITGSLDEELTEDDLDRISLLGECVAVIGRTTISQPGRQEKVKYVLIDAEPAMPQADG